MKSPGTIHDASFLQGFGEPVNFLETQTIRPYAGQYVINTLLPLGNDEIGEFAGHDTYFLAYFTAAEN